MVTAGAQTRAGDTEVLQVARLLVHAALSQHVVTAHFPSLGAKLGRAVCRASLYFAGTGSPSCAVAGTRPEESVRGSPCTAAVQVASVRGFSHHPRSRGQ